MEREGEVKCLVARTRNRAESARPATRSHPLALLTSCHSTPYPSPSAQWHPVARFLFEFVLIAVPSLLSMTLLAGSDDDKDGGAVRLAQFLATSLAGALALHLASVWLYGMPILSVDASTPGHALSWLLDDVGSGSGGRAGGRGGRTAGRKAFLSNYRSGMMLCT